MKQYTSFAISLTKKIKHVEKSCEVLVDSILKKYWYETS